MIAAGIADKKTLAPKTAPITKTGRLACAIASPINPRFRFITKDPIIGRYIPTKIEIRNDLIINEYENGSSKVSNISFHHDYLICDFETLFRGYHIIQKEHLE